MKKNKFYLKLYACIFAVAFVVLLMIVPTFYPNQSAVLPTDTIGKSTQTNTARKARKKKKVKSKMNQSKLIAVPPGYWGARGIGLVVEESGVKIEYDCADGEIEQKLMIDGQGKFDVSGVHIRGLPGPVRMDTPPQRQPARYEGQISGKTLTLKVTLTETKQVIGEFTLEQDKTALIVRCL